MDDTKMTKEDENILDAADLLIILEVDKTKSNLSLLTTACTLIVMSARGQSQSRNSSNSVLEHRLKNIVFYNF